MCVALHSNPQALWDFWYLYVVRPLVEDYGVAAYARGCAARVLLVDALDHLLQLRY